MSGCRLSTGFDTHTRTSLARSVAILVLDTPARVTEYHVVREGCRHYNDKCTTNTNSPSDNRPQEPATPGAGSRVKLMVGILHNTPSDIRIIKISCNGDQGSTLSSARLVRWTLKPSFPHYVPDPVLKKPVKSTASKAAARPVELRADSGLQLPGVRGGHLGQLCLNFPRGDSGDNPGQGF